MKTGAIQAHACDSSKSYRASPTLIGQHPVLLAVVVTVCAAPLLLNYFGADFSSQKITLEELRNAPGGLQAIIHDRNIGFELGSGTIIHALLEWTAVMLAALTAIVAFSHFLTDRKNHATSIIGIALLTCAAMEAFHTLASLRIIEHTRDHADFIPFSWSLARTVNAAIFLIGAIICVRHIRFKTRPGELHFDMKLMLIVCSGFILVTGILLRAAATAEDLPKTLYPDAFVKRPFELASIALFLVAAPFLARLYKKAPTVLHATLLLSLIPHLVLELHMALGSSKLFDNDFVIAHALKIFAYALPFYGLVHNYVHSYRKVNHALYNDNLTSSSNRNYFYLAAEAAVARAARESRNVAFFYMDLDNFKRINDTYSHEIGDEILREFAARVQSCIRTEDCFARMGGDEFVLMISNFQHVEFLQTIAQKICASMDTPIITERGPLQVSCSIGISIYPEEKDLNRLLHNADLAMYEAKRQSSTKIKFFSTDLSAQHSQSLQMHHDLQSSLDREQFVLVYHPIFCDGRQTPCAFEALIRWQHPEMGTIMPSVFMPVAERSGLMDKIGHWVFETAFTQLSQWKKTSELPLRLFVNCSRMQLADASFAPTLAAIMHEHDVSGAELTIEIDESEFENCAREYRDTVLALLHMDIGIAVGEYGDGGALLPQLHKLPLNTIKLDCSLVAESVDCARSRAVLASTIELARKLGICVVAQGVENLDQLRLLRELGCQTMQGLLLAPPMDSKACSELLLQSEPLSF